MTLLGQTGLAAATFAAAALGHNIGAVRTFTNPSIPGWHSDPSCVHVPELDNTTFCTSSTFMTFPGAPVYASKDLVNWKLASHAFTRDEQLPKLSSQKTQTGGIFASTIRYHQGTMYLITIYQSWENNIPGKDSKRGDEIKLFKTTDPYDDASWTVIDVQNPGHEIDPDLYFEDGRVYMLVAEGFLSEIDINTGKNLSDSKQIWGGDGGYSPEGPHLYKKDDYYYMIIASGGTEQNHSAIIARSENLWGPYTADPKNPILTNRGTNEYIQHVGHADLWQTADGHWWGMALGVRSGPAGVNYPMGRESFLFHGTWEKNGWPVFEQVRGTMEGPLPSINRDLPGDGDFVGAPDVVDFQPGKPWPKHWVNFRSKGDFYEISPKGHLNTLKISPSITNLTGFPDSYDVLKYKMAFVARRQEHTIFDYTVDIDFAPKLIDEEAGITLFLTQKQHMDIGIVNLSESGKGCGGKGPKQRLAPHLRFRVEKSGKPDGNATATVVVPVPQTWRNCGPIRLHIKAINDHTYVFGASPSKKPSDYIELARADASVVTGGGGIFLGTLVGAYSTSNGGDGKTPAYFSRWRYTPVAQQIDFDEFVRY